MKNNPLNFFKHWKTHGWRRTVKDWKKNYYYLDTPEQLLKKEITSHVGMIGAFLIALVSFAYKGSWSISLIMVFATAVSYYTMKGKLMQLRKLKEMMEQFNDIKGDDINGI